MDQEDLVDEAYQNSNKQNTAVLAQPSIPSQPLDFMFIEKKGEVCLLGVYQNLQCKLNFTL